MTGREFYDAVQEAGELTWLGCVEGRMPEEAEVFIRTSAWNGFGVIYAFPVTEILSRADQVLEVLFGRRVSRVVTQISRIVGYYSRVQNWNRSKLAELRDRQAGNYGLPEEQVRTAVA